MTLDEIYKEIKKSNSFVILTHENPDGDAIGSAITMALALKYIGKQDVDIYLKEYPECYKFLPGVEMIKSEIQKVKYDMAIVVDCSNLTRISGMYRDLFENSDVKVQFDHHNKNSMFADYNIVNPVSPACCQVLSSTLDYFKIEINKEIATNILTGIITDTYGFQIPETSAESFEFAAYALSKGVNVSKIYRQVLTLVSKPRFDIQNLATQRLEFFEEGKIAYTYITKEDERKFGTKNGDLSSIVEIARNIDTVEISIFVYEKEKGYKVSIRTNEYVDASAICLTFGGGGHFFAAGVSIAKELPNIKEEIIKEAKKYLKK